MDPLGNLRVSGLHRHSVTALARSQLMTHLARPPKLPSVTPQIPTVKDHKGPIKGPLRVLVETEAYALPLNPETLELPATVPEASSSRRRHARLVAPKGP